MAEDEDLQLLRSIRAADQHDQREQTANSKYASDQSTHNLQMTREAEATRQTLRARSLR